MPVDSKPARTPLVNRLRRVFGLAPTSSNGTPSKAVPTIDGANPFYPLASGWAGVPGDVDEVDRQTAYAASALIYVAMNYRASNLKEPPIQVVREDPNDPQAKPEPLPGHRVQQLLMEPSPDYSFGELINLTQQYQDLTGGAIWVKDANTMGSVGQVSAMSHDEFSVETAGGRYFGRFTLNNLVSGREVLGPDEVIYFHDLNPHNRHEPVSRVDVALSWLNLNVQLKRTIKQMLRKAMFPGGVVSADPSWNPSQPQLEQERARFKQWHSGPANTGEPLFMLGGMQFSQTAMPLDNLVPQEILDRVEAIVASVFGVPAVVLSFLAGLKNSPWSQMKEARTYAYEDTLVPIWRDKAATMTRGLLSMDERLRGEVIQFDLSQVMALRPDMTANISNAQAATVATLDERRAMIGLEPVGGEDGEWIQARASASFGDPLEEDPLDEGDEELEDDQDPSEEEDDELQKQARATKARDLERTAAWIAFDLESKAAEGKFAAAVTQALKGQSKAVVKLFKDALDDGLTTAGQAAALQHAKDAALAYLDADGAELLEKAVAPLIDSRAELAVRAAAREAGLSFSDLEDGLAEFAKGEAVFLTEVMGQTTGKRILTQVLRAQDEQLSVSELAKRLETDPGFSRTRARRVARTETTRVANGAKRTQLEAFSERTGATVFKSWLSSRDELVRPEHVDLDDGSEIPVDAKFRNGLTEPGEPNCRCTLTFRIG